MSYSHEEFIEQLMLFGLDVKSVYKGVAHDTTHNLYANERVIPIRDYEAFGYYCGGVYAKCNRTPKTEFSDSDVSIAVTICVNLQEELIKRWEEEVDYFDVVDWLRKRESRTKIEQSAIDRVVALLKDSLQDMRNHKRS